MKTVFIIIIMLLLPLLSFSETPSSCAPSSENCDFYKCESARLGCDQDDYLIQFGDKFCRKYLRNQDEYSSQGERFLIQVRACLQTKLAEQNFSANKKTCRQMEDFAFLTHTDCYVSSGYCELSKSDQRKIMMVAKFKLFNRKVWASYSDLKDACEKK